MLDRHPHIAVIGGADSAAAGLAAVATSHPDVVILDARLAGEAATVRALLAACPHARIVAFGVVESEETIVRCAEAGVAGYVPCEAGLDELVAVVEGALQDELVCSPRIAGTLLRRVGALARERGAAGPEVRLTSRETQIVGLIDEGLSNKEIAARLQIGLTTVKNHIHHILEKLDVSRRGEAAARVRALSRRAGTGSSDPPDPGPATDRIGIDRSLGARGAEAENRRIRQRGRLATDSGPDR